MKHKSINIKGTLLNLDKPLVMGILNVTPDSFYAGSRKQTEAEIEQRIQEILTEGGKIIDIGGYSSRPDAEDVSPKEEMNRLHPALQILRDHYPDIPVSVDTFRAQVASESVEVYGAALINDIAGGALDDKMYDVIAQLNTPYILMHMVGTPRTMQQHCNYHDLSGDILLYFSQRLRQLRLRGVKDIIVDPGFGFSKTLDQNYALINHLGEFKLLEAPLLIGISRKSMLYKLLGCTPAESLNATTALHFACLQKGADILRVHDVKAAVETIQVFEKLKQTETYPLDY